MDKPFLKKSNAPNFSNPAVQLAFIQDTESRKELLQKELDVNQAEQRLLTERIRLMKDFVNDLSSSDPQYSMLLTQIHMDQIEKDELQRRSANLSDQLNS